MIDSGRSRKRRAGKNSIWLGLTAAFAVSSLVGTGAYYGCRYYSETVNDGFLKGTVVDGEDVRGLSVDEAAALITDKYENMRIVITEDGETDLEGNPAYYGYKIDEKKLRENLQSAFDTMKSDRMSVLKSIFDRFEMKIEAGPEQDEKAFREVVQVNILITPGSLTNKRLLGF